ncbi:Uncharacterised protein [Vibrio cholerae]|nr:Uncharacterised protein [Vibrio cholerae]
MFMADVHVWMSLVRFFQWSYVRSLNGLTA